MGFDFPAAVGFEVVPAADVGGEVDADAAAAFAVWGDVFDVGGGGCGGSGGGVGGVPVAHGDELGQPRRCRVGAGVVSSSSAVNACASRSRTACGAVAIAVSHC